MSIETPVDGAGRISESDLTEMVRQFANLEIIAPECFKVQDRVGSLVPLQLWPSQVKLNRKIRDMKRRRKPVRLVILKTRRSGFTIGSTLQMFSEIAFLPGRKGLIIADQYEPAGDEAFGYLRDYQTSYSPFQRFGESFGLPEAKLKMSFPYRILWGEGSVEDDDEKDPSSKITLLSAEGGDVGRGGGRHWVLADEAAWWRDAETTMTAVMNMVPDLPDTGIIVQSTANGVGGAFYDQFRQAQDPLNQAWEWLFFGWTEDTNNRIELDQAGAVRLNAKLDRVERDLHSRHNVTLEQIAWRRWAIEAKCQGKLEIFHQEYPFNPEEAFLSSGRVVFDMHAVAAMPATEGERGELEIIESGPIRKLVFIPKSHGALEVFQRPLKGHRYAIGADPSQGKDVNSSEQRKQTRSHNPDWSVGAVFDIDTGVQVAQLRARLRPVAFAEYLVLLGKYYRNAFIVPEANDNGFVDALIGTHYPMELLYNRSRPPGDNRPGDPKQVGFLTTTLTRSRLIALLENALRNREITAKSTVLISELQTFIVTANGKAEHMAGHHDDCVFAAALAVEGIATAPSTVQDDSPKVVSGKPEYYGQPKRVKEDDDD